MKLLFLKRCVAMLRSTMIVRCKILRTKRKTFSSQGVQADALKRRIVVEPALRKHGR